MRPRELAVMQKTFLPAALLLVLASCGGVTRLSYADSGSQVDLDTGDRIEVSLESNPGTGYRWDPTVVPDMLVLRSDEYVEPDTDLVGVPGIRVLTYQAADEGAGILRFEYVRPFEELPVPQRVAVYLVIVDEAMWPPEPPETAPGTSSATAP